MVAILLSEVLALILTAGCYYAMVMFLLQYAQSTSERKQRELAFGSFTLGPIMNRAGGDLLVQSHFGDC